MKKVRTYIEIKEYEDGQGDVEIFGEPIDILANIIAVLIDFQERCNISPSTILATLFAGWRKAKETKSEAFTDGD